ncbi:SET and MYND domain-containing protein 4 isoform X3 [Monomorium pharaonis]|uniref:SET and MYND domain-containing protein 4 isoform X3 n=1 Tax=Monomorium pharaonis TaxID=307658 RepID=UPI00102E122D|nr:SET and MYND domain-containing protein 4 isoform X3 [Monomorium pharaonis]
MQDQDEFYRNLCSSETLRSGRRGFFHDFSGHVMQTAGDTWTSGTFGRIDDDVGRVRAIFTDARVKDAVADTLANVKPLFRDKDAEISRRKRLEGYQLAAVGEHEKALLLFSQAVLRAPQPGGNKTVDQGLSLPLALLGRAGTFTALKEYHFALEDLRLAAEHDLPDKPMRELERRREECERILKDNESSLVPVDPRINKLARLIPDRERGDGDGGGAPLNGAVNSELRWSSGALEIRETTTAGKHAVATAEIHPGDILLVEPPLAGCLLPEFYGTHCQHCYARLRAPIGCPNCSCVAFCGKKCRDVALTTYHKYECKVLALLIGSGMSVLSMVALRMVTQEGPRKCLKIYEKLKKNAVEKAAPPLAATTTTSTATTTGTATPDTHDMKSPVCSKSARRRIRRRKLKESRRDEEITKMTEENGTKEICEGGDDERHVDVAPYGLVTHADRRTSKDFLERSLMAAFLLKCLQRVGFFACPTPDDEVPGAEEITVAALLLRNLQLLQFNAHEFFETRVSAEHRFRGSRPVYLGVAIYPTVARFNHDCYPAVTSGRLAPLAYVLIFVKRYVLVNKVGLLLSSFCRIADTSSADIS